MDCKSRMTWDMIKEAYPDQWVGLVDVKWNPDNSADIESAVVEYSDKSKNELTHMQIETKGALVAVYTTPDNIFELGAVGCFV